MLVEITTNPHPSHHGGASFNRITARRKNGDKAFVFAATKRQCLAIKGILMKLARHYGPLPMITFADFIGVERINASNDDLIECLSAVPDPYAQVDLRAAMVATTRDFRICERVRAQDPTYKHLLAVCDCCEDWHNFWRVRSKNGFTPERIAEEAEFQKLKADNRRRLQQRGLCNGQH
jgi:hypothetical protein